MKLDSVMQLQAMNQMMKGQFDAYPISNVMIFGIAGGNGLEHIQKGKFERVYGVDVNSSYLKEIMHRYPDLDGLLECLCINLIDETDKLPKADMVIANLLIEYIGYECFKEAVRQVNPKYVSCIIQINIEDITKAVKYRRFYLHKFLSATLSSFAVALATAQSSALQNKNLFFVKFIDI